MKLFEKTISETGQGKFQKISHIFAINNLFGSVLLLIFGYLKCFLFLMSAECLKLVTTIQSLIEQALSLSSRTISRWDSSPIRISWKYYHQSKGRTPSPWYLKECMVRHTIPLFLTKLPLSSTGACISAVYFK